MQIKVPGGAGDSKDSDVPLKANPSSPTGMGIDIPLNQQAQSKPQEKVGDPEVILAGMSVSCVSFSKRNHPSGGHTDQMFLDLLAAMLPRIASCIRTWHTKVSQWVAHV
jgi:hypothetical protein